MPKMSKKDFENKFYNNFNKEEFEVVGDYINNHTPIMIRHKCGAEFTRIPHTVTKKNATCFCPVCDESKNNTRAIIVGFNDIASTNKELFSLLKYKEDGYKYRCDSHNKTYFICPNCGKEYYRTITQVNRSGLKCACNSKNASFIEKFVFNLLRQINVSFEYQYSDEWTKRYNYDFYIPKFDNMILELDGHIGHGKSNSFGEDAFNNCLRADAEKDDLAIKHGYQLVRIDCAYPTMQERYNYLVDALEKSILCQYIDFENINYKECYLFAIEEVIKQIALDWNSGLKATQQLADKYKVSRQTMSHYLSEASNIGLIKESFEEVRRYHYDNLPEGYLKNKCQKVKCVTTGEIFNSINQAIRKTGIRELKWKLRSDKEIIECGKLQDGTTLFWQKIS